MMDNSSKKYISDFRFKSLVPLITSYIEIESKKILDFGCGAGHSTFALALEGGLCTGIDISESSIRAARENQKQHFKSYTIDFIHSIDTTALPFEKESFDVVTCNAVFEHIYPWKREAHFREIFRVTKSGGIIVLRGTPNRYFPMDGHTSELWFIPWLPLWIAKYYVILRNGGIKKTDKIAQRNMNISDKLKIIPDEEWFVRGIRGVSFGDIKRWIDHNQLKLYLLNDNNFLELEKYSQISDTWGKRPFFMLIVHYFVAMLNIFSISVHHFFPYLNLIFRRENKRIKSE